MTTLNELASEPDERLVTNFRSAADVLADPEGTGTRSLTLLEKVFPSALREAVAETQSPALLRGEDIRDIATLKRHISELRHDSHGHVVEAIKDAAYRLGWVASRYAGARPPVKATVQNTVIASSGDLAYTVGFERGPVRVERGREREMVIRVTHIYRRTHEGWKLIHRHADFPPADQRQRQQNG
jgi:hypothetical protein